MSLLELQSKDVISVNDGSRIGYICDIEIDVACASICAIVVEKNSIFNYFRFCKEPREVVIPIDHVVSIGKDVILVNVCI